ncbi:translation initiation factor IF-2 [Andreesenia angusta]|uniref:Translation initiation factor IF-2 n=1 Tax=Andreesenia angusta TaxID=39480 RepID=A0A1S1V879_9FIRM|nr:translation initiation factor IF-2 [Andreesenia angusta]OHW62803.1 translation initiation factor IF-2 [Andreesenia angusta]
MKIRVYELAKDLGLTSKDLIEKLKELDIKVGNHMSTLDEETVEILKELFTGAAEGIEQAKEAQVEEKSEPENQVEDKKEIKRKEDTMEKTDNIDQEVENKSDLPVIKIGESVQVKELAEKLGVQVSDVITKLIGLGVMATLNQEIDYDTASIIAAEYEYAVEGEVSDIENMEELLEQTYNYVDDEADLKSRPPVVTVMGHVDHGKTSLLDAIRNTNVTNKEAGGITQHIGASTVKINNEKIVFLDTPGHEAFTSMRARGAQITDVAILVVAADDGVMPQTVEAINHSKAAGVPIIVAVNKIDKPAANPDKVKQELTEYGLVPEDWGGDTIFVNVSAKTGEGIEDILEMILLVAEVQELKANPNRRAVGTIIEAKLDKGRGAVATVLVQKGTLSVGDAIITGKTYGRVRAMIDDKGKKIKKAGPSTPVEIIGLSEVPESGDRMYMVEDDKKARYLGEKMKGKHRDAKMKEGQKVSLDNLFDTIQDGQVKELNIIVKADVRGTIEAIKQSLLKLSNEEVRVNPIHGGVGAITESDIMLASASNAIVIGFNVRPTNNAMEIASSEEVDVRTYRVIYNAIEDIKAAIDGMLEPEYKEVFQGRAEVREIFKIPGGVAAGIYVQTGKITRASQIRILRDNIVIYEGELSSLRRFKDDVKELAVNYEGGLAIEGFKDMKEGDVVEAFIMEEIKR